MASFGSLRHIPGCFLYVSSTLPQPARREEDEVGLGDKLTKRGWDGFRCCVRRFNRFKFRDYVTLELLNRSFDTCRRLSALSFRALFILRKSGRAQREALTGLA